MPTTQPDLIHDLEVYVPKITLEALQKRLKDLEKQVEFLKFDMETLGGKQAIGES